MSSPQALLGQLLGPNRLFDLGHRNLQLDQVRSRRWDSNPRPGDYKWAGVRLQVGGSSLRAVASLPTMSRSALVRRVGREGRPGRGGKRVARLGTALLGRMLGRGEGQGTPANSTPTEHRRRHHTCASDSPPYTATGTIARGYNGAAGGTLLVAGWPSRRWRLVNMPAGTPELLRACRMIGIAARSRSVVS
jgi:hypothetical protein